MPTFSTPTGSAQRYIPALNRNAPDSIPGTKKIYEDHAAFIQGVEDERNCVGMGLPVWYSGIDIQILTEPAGVKREWSLSTAAGSPAGNASASHGRKVVISSFAKVLPADVNRVLATNGAPGSGVGADGDVALDPTAGVIYAKASGAWAVEAALGGGGSGGAVTSVAGKTGVVTLVKADVGLSNVENTADSAKPVSTAQLNALNAKAPLASPALTGVPTAPTAASGTNTTQVASTAFVRAEVAALVDAAPGALDTLNELAAALGDDPNFAATMVAALATKSDKPIAHATTTALQTVLPAAANLGALALVGSAAPYTRYMSNGTAWLEVPEPNPVAIQVATSRALTSADNGRVLEATATVTLTVPAGLPAGFRCVVVPSGTTSVAFSGAATGNGAATTITRAAAANAMFGILQRGSSANSYVIDGA